MILSLRSLAYWPFTTRHVSRYVVQQYGKYSLFRKQLKLGKQLQFIWYGFVELSCPEVVKSWTNVGDAADPRR